MQDNLNSSGSRFLSAVVARIFWGQFAVGRHNASVHQMTACIIRGLRGVFCPLFHKRDPPAWMSVIVEALLSQFLAVYYMDSRKRADLDGAWRQARDCNADTLQTFIFDCPVLGQLKTETVSSSNRHTKCMAASRGNSGHSLVSESAAGRRRFSNFVSGSPKAPASQPCLY